jgi:hypothetical protein
MRIVLGLILATVGVAVSPSSTAEEPATDKLLYDFETDADLATWSNLVLPDAKNQEPAVKIERSSEQAVSGKASLKLTFAGGRWPTITTTAVDDSWLKYQTFQANVVAGRPCLVGFTVFQETSERGEGWDPVVGRWTKTAFLKPGDNLVSATLPQPNDYALHPSRGKIVRFEIFMYQPHEGETLFIDRIRLTNEKLPPPEATTFHVAGTDWTFAGPTSAQAVIEMGKKLKDQWQKPVAQTVQQIEAQMRDQFAKLKKEHPRAVLAILRDGEKGFDPANPENVYAGWLDAHVNSHGPDGMTVSRAENRGSSASQEIFMRHRSAMMRVDLASIPTRAKILAARLIVVRSAPAPDDRDPEKEASMWVVEPCSRRWVENEVNAYEFAKDEFWQAIGGMAWGENRDFEPIFLAHGPGQGQVTSWDFAHAVRYWSSGEHENHGFMLHGDSHDYLMAHSREAEKIENRPAVIVIYEPR